VASIVEVNPWAWQPCAGIDNEGKLDDDRAMPVPVGSPDPTADRHQEIRRNYAAEIENIDTRIGEIIDTVARRGELDNTVVIYSADHGEMLGDHDRWTKMVPYEGSVGIPLAVAGPGVATDSRSNALVSLEDIAATILDYARVQPAAGLTAQSLRPLLDGGRTNHRDAVISGLDYPGGRWRAVITRRYKLVVHRDVGENVLYDWLADPGELHNIAEAKPEVVRSLTEILGSGIKERPGNA
jgi:choline-sulfatase